MLTRTGLIRTRTRTRTRHTRTRTRTRVNTTGRRSGEKLQHAGLQTLYADCDYRTNQALKI